MSQTISQQGLRFDFDVLVFGSGIAGLAYVLELSATHPKTKIALITKANLTESNSYYAQGGIAAAFHPKDSVAAHVADTLAAGDELCQLDAVESILQQGSESIEYLSAQGVQFDKD